MEIIIKRFAVCGMALHGRLFINGEHVCDTLESARHHLPLGNYAIEKKGGEKKKGKDGIRFVCRNGPFSLHLGEIAVGECHYLGFLIRCDEYYVPLMARIRMALNRHQNVTVIILKDDDGNIFSYYKFN